MAIELERTFLLKNIPAGMEKCKSVEIVDIYIPEAAFGFYKMKRKVYIVKNGCVFVREGVRHSVFFNSQARRIPTIPRHNEIDNFLAKKKIAAIKKNREQGCF